MKRLILALFWSMALLTTGCNSKANQVSQSPDFEFVFQESACGTRPIEILDTKSHTLIHNPIFGKESFTIQLQLTDSQMDTVRQKIVEIDFFKYPTIFIVPDEQIRGYQAPASTTQMTVTIGTKSHSVTWSSEILTEPPYMDEKNLRDLDLMILNMIWSNQNYKQLREQGVCA